MIKSSRSYRVRLFFRTLLLEYFNNITNFFLLKDVTFIFEIIMYNKMDNSRL